VFSALSYALRSRNVQDGQLIHHSDKGCPYTAPRFTQRVADAGVAPSSGSAGSSYGNALAENLWSTIKTELIYLAWQHFRHSRRGESDDPPLHRWLIQPSPRPGRARLAVP
jgi:putative transposase